MLLVFEKDEKWTGGIGKPSYSVKAGVPIDVCAYTAKIALDSGRAKLHSEIKKNKQPAKADKSKAEGNPAKKDKGKAEK